MSAPSNWPLPKDGVRFIVPHFLAAALAAHPIARELHPLSFGYYPRARGHAAERRIHDDHLLIYCRAGRGHLSVEEVRTTVEAGDLVLLPQGVAHAYYADETEPWSIYWVHFAGERALDFCRQADGTALPRRTTVGLAPRVVSDFETLLSVRRAGYRLAPFLIAANQLKQLVASLALQGGAATDRLLAESDALMRANLGRRVDLATLARAAGLSRFHFAKRYKAVTGTSPIQRFIHLKIERACHLLDVTDAGVADVAAELGYDDPLYFSRVFRNVVGVSPRGYRMLRRG